MSSIARNLEPLAVPVKPRDAKFGSRVRRKDPKGFTLVELLVVLAIIAVLAALLLPSLTRAKASVNSVKCKSNLKQFGIALALYVADYHAYPPDYQFHRFAGMYFLFDYLNSMRHRDELSGVARCPSHHPPSGDSWPFPNFSPSYGYNSRGVWAAAYTQPYTLGLGGEWAEFSETPGVRKPVDRLPPYISTREGDVKAPADMIAMGDGFAAFKRFITFNGKEYPDSDRALIESVILYRGPWIQGDGLAETIRSSDGRRRHQGRLNVVFCDGHVEGPRVHTLFYEKTDTAVRRWNRDNEPHREAWPFLP